MAERTIKLAGTGAIAVDIARAIVAAQDELTEIDGATGDGDHGINMGKGFRMVIERLEGRETTLAEAFRTISDTLLDEIGGSMGPLYGSFFLEAGDVLDGHETLDAETLAAALRAGEDAVADLGEAKPGDKTLIDVLAPSREAFEAATGRGASFADALAAMREASAHGLEATRGLVAKRGRASRLGDRSRGSLDAGAASSNIIIRTLADDLIERLGA